MATSLIDRNNVDSKQDTAFLLYYSYLAKHGLKDVCNYSTWPVVVVDSPTPIPNDDADLPW
jgi:hypothetical protein